MGQTLDVIWVAVRAILQVFICCGVGAMLAHMGHLGRETLTSLGKISYYVLIPSMAFYKICVGVRLEQLLDAWPFLLYPTLFACVGFAVGVILNRLLQIQSKPLRHSIVITLMFGNFGNLPFSLLETITKDVYPFSEDPTSLPRSLAYASIFLSTASLWLWSFGPWYIRSSRDINSSSDSDASSADGEAARDEKETPLDDLSNVSSSSDEPNDTKMGTERISSPSIGGLSPNETATDLNDMSVAVPLESFQPPSHPLHRRVWLQICHLASKIHTLPIWSVLTPSTIACILAVLILAIPPIHRSMFVPVNISTSPPASTGGNTTVISTPNGFSNSTTVQTDTNADGVCLSSSANPRSKPPLQFVADSIGSLANITVPISLLLLGSNLYSTVKTQWNRARLQRETSQKESILPLSKRVLFGAVFVRLVLLPVIFFFFTWVLSRSRILPADPLVTVILVLQSCMPSAINLIILAQLQDDQLVVEQLSTILLVQYLFCTFSIFTCISLGIKLFL